MRGEVGLQFDASNSSQMQAQQARISSGDVAGRAGGLGCVLSEAACDRHIELESLVTRELPRLQRVAMRWLRNREDAEDAVQDAVLSAYKHIAGFEGRARMSSWLMSIVMNSARMHLRRNRRNLLPFEHVLDGESLAGVDILPDLRPNPEQSCQHSELCGILAQSINRLCDAERVAFELFSLKGLSQKEAAKMLGIPVGTLKARLARGRVRLSRKIRRLAGTSGCRSARIVPGEAGSSAGGLQVASDDHNSLSRS